MSAMLDPTSYRSPAEAIAAPAESLATRPGPIRRAAEATCRERRDDLHAAHDRLKLRSGPS
jgi:hypothetical protein